MFPLIIDKSSEERIRTLVEYAQKNPIVIFKGKSSKVAGDDIKHVCDLDIGYRLVFSIEHQPLGNVRHISISVNHGGDLPQTKEVNRLMKMTGFQNVFQKCMDAWIETVAPGHYAINALELI